MSKDPLGYMQPVLLLSGQWAAASKAEGCGGSGCLEETRVVQGNRALLWGVQRWEEGWRAALLIVLHLHVGSWKAT